MEIRSLECDSIELDVKTPSVVLRDVSGTVEIDCNLDLNVVCNSLKGEVAINQVSATSKIHIPEDTVFTAVTKGIGTSITYEKTDSRRKDLIHPMRKISSSWTESRASLSSARIAKGTNEVKTNYLKKYIISSYILVWLLIIFVAGTASLVFHAPPVIMWVVRNLIAWSPTYLLLICWKHFRPDETRTTFMKRCFSGKVKLHLLLFSFALTFGISVLSLFIYTVVTGKPMLSYINLGTTALPLSIFLSLTSGPTGEELDGAAFCGRNLTRSTASWNPLSAKLVWCFWHTLLWIVDSEFTDWRAIPYVISNIVVITSITVLMNILLELHND